MSMGTTETLARWIASTTYDKIPTAAIEQAKKSILDYIGTAAYGTTSQLGKIILEFTREQGGNPQARVIGTDIRTASTQAAFANGTTGHSEDFDDLGGCGGHPATVLTPTVLALGDELHLSGRDVLTAWVVGYEVGTRTAVDVLDSRRRLAEAETNYARSRYDYLINVVRLKLAAGTLKQDDVVEINQWLTASVPTPAQTQPTQPQS